MSTKDRFKPQPAQAKAAPALHARWSRMRDITLTTFCRLHLRNAQCPTSPASCSPSGATMARSACTRAASAETFQTVFSWSVNCRHMVAMRRCSSWPSAVFGLRVGVQFAFRNCAKADDAATAAFLQRSFGTGAALDVREVCESNARENDARFNPRNSLRSSFSRLRNMLWRTDLI